MTNFVHQGEINFGSRDVSRQDEGLDRASTYFKIYIEEKKKEKASRELKSIYFGGNPSS